ncbi:MAG: hypothetical protein HY749_01325 [Gammaproteobacteria bacterium]|nr:hypothetical protein [Gammaproteobacteria bacterium]MBI5617895.1 hypothetical protein [Gammaproteobacteria bacterium]
MTLPASRRLVWLEAACGIAILSALLYFSASDLLSEFGGDNAVYWLTANHYSPYGATHPLAAEYAAASRYPPLYPLALAAFGGGTSVFAAHLVSAALLCVGLLAARAYYLVLGIPRAVALALVVLLALVPIMRNGAIELQSEDLYLPLSLAALALMVRYENSSAPSRLALVGLLVAASLLTRTAGITLVAACAAHALFARRPAWLLPIAIAALAWAWNSHTQHSTNAYSHELVDGYLRQGIGPRLLTQLENLPLQWSLALGGLLETWPPVILLSTLGFAFACAAAGRAWRRHVDGYYALAYLAVLVVWPFPAEMQRLTSMILPVLLGQAYLFVAARRALPAEHRPLIAAMLVGVPILVFALPDTVGFAVRMHSPVPALLEPYRRTAAWQQHEPQVAIMETALRQAIYATLADVDRLVPAGECVYSIKPSVASLYGRRRSLQTPPDSDAVAFRAAALAGGCRYFVISLLVSPSARTLYHPLAILRAELTPLAQHPDPFDPRKRLLAMLAKWTPPDAP